MASAASSVGSAVVGICPVKAGSGSFQPVPIPSDRPAVWSWSALRRDASPMKAVLHDRAKSTEKGTVPEVSPSKLVKVLPPTVTLGGQAAGVSGVTPVGMRAVVVTILNDDPGGYCPLRARLNEESAGALATVHSYFMARAVEP